MIIAAFAAMDRWGVLAQTADVRAIALVEPLQETLYAEEIRRNLTGMQGVVVPEVFPRFTRQRVMVMRYMPGRRIDLRIPVHHSHVSATVPSRADVPRPLAI